METEHLEQGSEDWHEARYGLPTASKFSEIITGTGKASTSLERYAATLAAEQYAGANLESWQGNQWTERGHELEHEARLAYSMLRGVDVEEVGFIVKDGAGCSPDGLVEANGLVEIKCLAPHNHVLMLSYFAKHGRVQPSYVPQSQGQIYVCEREWNDMFFYHPALPELLVRLDRDEDYITALTKQITLVINERDRLTELLRKA